MSCLFCFLLFSFVSRLSFNFDHPLPAMHGSQTTMDTVHQHPLPWAPPGCSKAYAWPAKWSNDRRGAGWISRPPTAHRSWGSLETWETERNGTASTQWSHGENCKKDAKYSMNLDGFGVWILNFDAKRHALKNLQAKCQTQKNIKLSGSSETSTSSKGRFDPKMCMLPDELLNL